jgi:cytoskeletal protein RodZ
MSDDVFEAFGDDNIFNDDDEPVEAEGAAQNNRTFIMAVAVLGGLLVCAVGAFMVWALVLSGPRQTTQAPVLAPVESPAVEVIVETDTPEPTETPMPTDTPAPTPTSTPLLGPTSTPPSEGAASAEGEEAEGTQVVRRTPTPSPTASTLAQASGSTATSAEAASGTTATAELSKTGLGEWVLIGVALLLLATMVLARRLRTA